MSLLKGFLHVFVTKSVGKRFHELSIGRNDRLGLGTSKIEFLAKNSKKKQGTSMIFLVFPACGVGCLTSFAAMEDENFAVIDVKSYEEPSLEYLLAKDDDDKVEAVKLR